MTTAMAIVAPWLSPPPELAVFTPSFVFWLLLPSELPSDAVGSRLLLVLLAAAAAVLVVDEEALLLAAELDCTFTADSPVIAPLGRLCPGGRLVAMARWFADANPSESVHLNCDCVVPGPSDHVHVRQKGSSVSVLLWGNMSVIAREDRGTAVAHTISECRDRGCRLRCSL
jgi:hypothetical protein